MDNYVIKGPCTLRGRIPISGAKNAAVAILPATLLAKGVYIIDNVPDISDTAVIFEIMELLGAKIEHADPGTVKIDTTKIKSRQVPFELAQKMRASYYFLGALLGMFQKAKVGLPGGCSFNKNAGRPIDMHIKGFEDLGATVSVGRRIITAKAKAATLIGNTVYFDKVSVGATINVMLAAVRAQGVTVIETAAKEPHVVDVANFLNLMGADIKGAGTDVIKIRGVSELHARDYSIIPDQIEAGTYMVAAAATGGDLTLENITPKHLTPISEKLRDCGAQVEEFDNSIRVFVPENKRLQACNINCRPYPGFPTDMQPQFAALLSLCDGISRVTDTVWPDRFEYVNQLIKMGAKIKGETRPVIIEGTEELRGAKVKADDLRAGAAMIIAGLCARGTTEISEIHHIDRGYENLVGKLKKVGADIKRVNDDPTEK